jgi:hypothetical protein
MTPARNTPGRPKGHPKTGGRKRGTPNKRTTELQARIRATGMMPLDFMIAVMRNAKAPLELRFEAARQAAPYVHPRLTAIEHSGTDGGAVPVEVKQVSDIEAARLIGRLLTKVGASGNGDSGK